MSKSKKKEKHLNIKPKIDKSLEVLENDYWGKPRDDDTNLVKKCHGLRQVPIKNLSEEDFPENQIFIEEDGRIFYIQN